MYLKLQPYRQHSLAQRSSMKLSARYFGPFQVRARIGKVAYELALLPECHIHPVFHVSLLKKFVDPKSVPLQTIPPLVDGMFQVTRNNHQHSHFFTG